MSLSRLPPGLRPASVHACMRPARQSIACPGGGDKRRMLERPPAARYRSSAMRCSVSPASVRMRAK
jgi:hypothetical protein